MGRVPTSVLVALSPPWGALLGLLGWVTGRVTTTCPGRGSQRPWSVTTICIRGVWVHVRRGVPRDRHPCGHELGGKAAVSAPKPDGTSASETPIAESPSKNGKRP